MSIQLLNKAFQTSLDCNTKLVLIFLSNNADPDNFVEFTLYSLVEFCDLRLKQIQASLRKLVRLNFISITLGDKHTTSNPVFCATLFKEVRNEAL